MNSLYQWKVLVNVIVLAAAARISFFDGSHFDCKDNDANRSFVVSEKTDALAEVSCSVEI